MKNLRIFETNILNRSMDFKSFFNDYSSDDFFNSSLSEKREEFKKIKKDFVANIINTGEMYGFDAKKMIILDDKKSNCSCYSILDKDSYKNRDNLLNVKVNSDMVFMKGADSLITLAYPVSDDPVLIGYDSDNEVFGMLHCNIDKVSDGLPCKMVGVFLSEFSSSLNSIKVYISSNLHKDNNFSLLKPTSIKNSPEIWKNYCKKKIDFNRIFSNGLVDSMSYQIDLEGAIVNMLLSKGVLDENIICNGSDTYSDSFLYSDCFSQKNGVESGKYLVGACFSDDDFVCDCGYVRSL